MESIKLTKIDAAKRQLEAAIILFFDDGDPIAIHTLVCAAYDVLDGINQHRGGKEMFVKRQYVKLPGKPTRGDINEYQNFLKHADKDPEGTLDFFPILTEPILADACKTYRLLANEENPFFGVFERWFHCRGGKDHFDWPPEQEKLLDDLLALFAQGDRLGFFARCAEP